MRATGRVRPGRGLSALGMVVGILFIGIGLFIAIPYAGAFGVLWTLMAVGITVYYGMNTFRERGLAHEVVEFDISAPPADPPPALKTTEQRLGDLDVLKQKGLVSAAEYEAQRRRILNDL